MEPERRKYDMNDTIGERIARLRKEKNITQTQLAEYLYVTPQTVSRWEVGSGTPEISLLPKIATFFGVSIDALFGLTSMNRANELVLKYSVLRDDRSFQEAMDCLNSQIQTMEAALEHKTEEAPGLQKDMDRLKALKVHLFLQQGRESFERALKIVDSFVEQTRDNPQETWYLPMRLQRLQLRAALEEGRPALEECERDYARNPNVITLRLYLEMLLIMQDYEKILCIQERDACAREILFPLSKDNLVLWKQLYRAAVGKGDLDFVEKHLESVLGQGTEKDRFDLLRTVIPLYKEKNLEEKRNAAKKELISMLPGLSCDDYFEEQIRKEIARM